MQDDRANAYHIWQSYWVEIMHKMMEPVVQHVPEIYHRNYLQNDEACTIIPG